jgi:Spy/CpxP family protein refolding chaperone
MKAKKFSLVMATALGGLLALSSVSLAQDTNAAPRAPRRGPTLQQRVDRMSSELNLNNDQKTKVTALLEKQGKERRELFGDKSLSGEERREKMRALMQDENKQLKTILTPDQFEKWQKLREQMRPRRQGGQGEPGGPAAPAPPPQPKSADNKAQ